MYEAGQIITLGKQLAKKSLTFGRDSLSSGHFKFYTLAQEKVGYIRIFWIMGLEPIEIFILTLILISIILLKIVTGGHKCEKRRK